MAQFTIYKSSDSGAPTLNGQAGSLITVLNYILVGGQGGNSAGIAYGTTPSAGWTQAYTGTNLVAYRGGLDPTTGHGTQFYLYINDAGPGAGTTQEARLCGYESMSSISTGFGQYPSAANGQGLSSPAVPGFLAFHKSNAATASARTWIAYADALTLYFFCQSDQNVNYYAFHFGDFYSYAGTADKWRSLFIGRTYENTAGAYDALGTCSNVGFITYSGTNYGTTAYPYQSHFSPRSFSGAGSCIAMSKFGDPAKANGCGATCTNGAFIIGNGAVPYPNPPDNGLYLSPVWVGEPTSSVVRGVMRGLWQSCHPIATFSDGQILTGSGAFAGKTFQILKQTQEGSALVMETSNTLPTN